MEMNKFNFDFKKLEDQKKFEELKPEYKQVIIDNDQDEATEIKRRVSAGEATSHINADEEIDKEKMNGKLVENKEIGISYFETIQELPVTLQEKTGVKRLRKRKVVSFPDDFYYIDRKYGGGFSFKSHDKERWLFLTDGRFPSYKTWTHAVGADRMMMGFIKEQVKGVQNGEFFQEFFPEPNLFEGIRINFFEKSGDGNIKSVDADKTDLSLEDARKNLSFFSMSAENRGSIWSGDSDGYGFVNKPIFVFGCKNRMLKEYIDEVKNNNDAKRILELSQWTVNDPLEIIRPDSLDYEKYKDLFYEAGLRSEESFPRPKFDVEKQDSLEMEIKTRFNISTIDFLLDEEDIKYGGHPFIPVVRHPDIKPFRWSHAELVVVPKGKELEIIFFENE